VALGRGEELLESEAFDADRRHAVQLVARLDELLRRHRLRPRDLNEVYVSIGPGSFTGLRVGVTVGRMLAQLVPGLSCVAVPTVRAVAENACLPGRPGLGFVNLGVVMDAKEGTVYAAVFRRTAGELLQAGPASVMPAEQFAADAPKPILLLGEALAYHRIAAEGITIGPELLWLPSAEGLWRVGRRMARSGQFEDFRKVRPLYLRRPEAVRLWEKRHSAS